MLKGSLTSGRNKAEVFGHFGHRPMPHSVVVGSSSMNHGNYDDGNYDDAEFIESILVRMMTYLNFLVT